MEFKRISRIIGLWNKKLHIYTGLFLLVFLWIFSFSGLLLNHSQWTASFWKEREENDYTYAVNIPEGADSAFVIENVMEQLALTGEVNNVKNNDQAIEFRVSKPGRIKNIAVDLQAQNAIVKELKFNTWGIIRTLHTFNGVDTIQSKPNWIVTRVWRTTMDIVAIGMIFLCISSWYMWYKTSATKTPGLLLLTAGFMTAVFFVLILGYTG
jgi:hypothetical protein